MLMIPQNAAKASVATGMLSRGLSSLKESPGEFTYSNLPWVWPLPDRPVPHDTAREKAKLAEHLNACHNGDVARIRQELIRCRREPAFFVMTFCFTKDEHDSRRPVKRFPRKSYIPQIIDEVHANQLIAIPKSRQIMLTWTMVCYFLQMAIFNRHRLIFFQSKKEDDAVALIDRVKHVYEYLPWWMKEAAPPKRPLHRLPFNKLMLANGSTIWGIPQGPDILRQHTASAILGDEAAFQNKAEDTYKAAKPTIDGGGKYVIVSSVNGKNFFYRVIVDQIDGDLKKKSPMQVDEDAA